MSDLDLNRLKDVSWTVQSTITQPGFDTLATRARQRRRRHRAIAVSTTATAALAVTGLVVGGLPYPDRATDPATSGTPFPSTPAPSTTDTPPPPRTAADILASTDRRLAEVVLAPGGAVISSWSSCRPLGCQQAVVSRDAHGGVVIGPAGYSTWLLGGDRERAVVLDPADLWRTGMSETGYTGDRKLTAVLMTTAGRSVVQLETLPDTTTVGAGDLLIRHNEAGPLLVDVDRRTVRRLVLGGRYTGRFGRSYRDGTGAVWLLAATSSQGVDLLRSTDGRGWQRMAGGSGDVLTSGLAVSPDGRTVALAVSDGEPIQEPRSVLRISRDGGVSWSSVPGRISENGLVAFDDGAVLVCVDDTIERLSAGDARLQPVEGAPRTERLVPGAHGMVGYDGNTVRVSDDQGAHWTRVPLR